MPRASHSSRFEHPNNIGCGLFPLRPKYSPQHSILKHPSLRSSLNVSDQVSHPYKTGKIIFLYTISVAFFNFRIFTIFNIFTARVYGKYALKIYHTRKWLHARAGGHAPLKVKLKHKQISRPI
jgi:hypothetical protein